MRRKFLRTHTREFNRFRRKKKHKWKKARGRDNKVRQAKRGKDAMPKIGMKSETERVIVIRNLKELENFKGKEIIIGKIGKKKKLLVLKKAEGRGIKILGIRKEKKNESNK